MIKPFAKKIPAEIPEELQQYIVAAIQGESDSIIHTTFPVHPNGFPLIISVYNDIPTIHIDAHTFNPTSRLNLAGQIQNADISLEINGLFGQMGLLLHPTTPYYLFHKSGDYLLNSCWCDFEKASPIDTGNLYLSLENCKNPVDRIPVILDFLKTLHRNRLPKIEWIDTALVQIFKLGGKITQEELAEKAQLSLRHFRRKFKEIIGVSPKYFCKVIQLNTVFELLNSNDDEKIHHLALDCGYYDQAHFINDFKNLIGESPNNFLNGRYAYVREYMGRVDS